MREEGGEGGGDLSLLGFLGEMKPGWGDRDRPVREIGDVNVFTSFSFSLPSFSFSFSFSFSAF